MANDLLLEIGLEEIPARFIRSAIDQLTDKMKKWLESSRIGFESAAGYATPRRLAVLVKGVSDKQSDISEEVKGPAKKIAQDEAGAWSKAALGFARSQGVATDSLFYKEIGGVEYVHAVKSSVGVETASVLAEGLASIITSMTFPKNMRWGTEELRFVRPIRWLVAMFGTAVVPLDIAGVQAGNVTRGHRFLGGEVTIPEPSAYERLLREQYVYVNIDERQRLILDQIAALADEHGWHIAVKDDLLEEVLFLVEYPTALYGKFNPDFLRIPQDVLITSMREHQRYFPVLDERGQLLPFFVTVRNGNAESLDQVVRGNEKVLRARLSDAKFFYEEDQKMPIESALSKLETIVYHEELGTVGDKVRRLSSIASSLADELGVDGGTAQAVERTAAICKFDLVTQMVHEFPELQGLMGEDYARIAGEPDAVARAINEHYRPRFSGDGAPATIVGAIVGIADKIDTIVGCFSLGIVPTGSQDPYALRRQAAGIVQTILERELPLTLDDLFGIALETHAKAGLLKRDAADIRIDLYDFFSLRVKNVLSEREIRYDVVDAVMGAIDDIASTVRRADALSDAVRQADFKTTVESFNRVANLAGKSAGGEVRTGLFEDPAEQELFDAWREAHAKAESDIAAGRESDALRTLGELKPAITRFFDTVMVMAEDERVRGNRLALLHGIASDLKRIADFGKLVW